LSGLNPPFNMSDWGGETLRQDMHWKFGMPPVNNANYAWIQHFIHHLSPVGVAGLVMARSARIAHSCQMKITKDVRKYAAEQGISGEEGLKKGMEEESKESVEKGAEVPVVKKEECSDVIAKVVLGRLKKRLTELHRLRQPSGAQRQDLKEILRRLVDLGRMLSLLQHYKIPVTWVEE